MYRKFTFYSTERRHYGKCTSKFYLIDFKYTFIFSLQLIVKYLQLLLNICSYAFACSQKIYLFGFGSGLEQNTRIRVCFPGYSKDLVHWQPFS